MKFAVFAALMAIALPAPALAADWVLAAESISDDKYYIDRQSIHATPNGYKRAWILVYYAGPDQVGVTGYRKFQELDCARGRDRGLQITFYKGKKVLGTNTTPADWTYIVPETNGEALFNFICRK